MFDLGDVVPLAVNVKDTAGALANATAVALTITLPDGTTATPSVTNSSTGVYSATYTPAVSGRFGVRWVATGTNASTYVDAFTVAAGAGLISLDEVKAFLNITSTTNDEELREFVAASTVAAEKYAQRKFVRESFTETHDGGGRLVVLRHPRATSLTAISEGGTSLSAGEYRLKFHGGAVERVSGNAPSYFTRGVDNISVTYVAGVTGDDLTLASHAVRQMVKHLWATQRGAKRPNTGDEWESGLGYTYPRRVMELLDPLSNSVGFA
jgi:hypothetical protein